MKRNSTGIFRKLRPGRGLCAGLLLATGPVLAADYQPVEDIRQAAEAHARQLAGSVDAEVSAAGLDQRLRLPRCTEELSSFAPAGMRPGRAATVGVRCGQSGWKVYVPVRMTIRKQVLVATRTLRRGETLTADVLRAEARDVTGLPYGYYQHPEVVEGQTAARAINAGSVIVPASLRAPTLVQRGQAVTLVARRGGMEIRARGRALSNGVPKERIQVRNESSGRIVEGIVRTADIVDVAG